MTRALLLLAILPLAAHAAPPSHARAGGMAVCEVERATCLDELATCDSELDALVARWDELLDEAIALLECHGPVVGPEGGRASSDDGLAFVSVPPGAVTKQTALTVERVERPPVTHAALSGVYDFGPDGQVFQAPATVCLDVGGKDASDACLGFLDESTDPPAWTCEDPCLEKAGDKVCGTTSHFTSFAVLLGGGGGGTCKDEDDGALSWKVGGVVRSADAAALVSIPPLALPKDLVVRVDPVARPVVDTPRLSGVYEFGPHGLTFAHPATVCLQGKRSDEPACLGYLDASVSPPVWRCEDPCLDATDDGLYCGTTSHFTNFAILLGGADPDTCKDGGR
ncbi:MAG: hypothetical protein H6732_18730 [Alphaproteobacteria bacterium]|nr:hypothetical protein [Alphaproteobacteria bacterium]